MLYFINKYHTWNILNLKSEYALEHKTSTTINKTKERVLRKKNLKTKIRKHLSKEIKKNLYNQKLSKLSGRVH